MPLPAPHERKTPWRKDPARTPAPRRRDVLCTAHLTHPQRLRLLLILIPLMLIIILLMLTLILLTLIIRILILRVLILRILRVAGGVQERFVRDAAASLPRLLSLAASPLPPATTSIAAASVCDCLTRASA